MRKNSNLILYLLGIIILMCSGFWLNDSALIVFLALGLILVSINEFKIPSHGYLIGGILTAIIFYAIHIKIVEIQTTDLFLKGTIVVGISLIYAVITSIKNLINKNKIIKNIIIIILSIILLLFASVLYDLMLWVLNECY